MAKRRNKRSAGKQLRLATRQQQVMLLNAMGFTTRQICEKLKIKSTATVHFDIKECLQRVNSETDLTTEQWRDLMLLQCAETEGELAEMKDIIDSLRKARDNKIHMKLAVIESIYKNRDRVIKLRGLEAPQKVQHSGSLDFNTFRERGLELEKQEEKTPAAALGRV